MIDFAKNNLERLIKLHHGHSYRTAGILFGFFPDIHAAQAAAAAIASTGVSVMVFGSQIMIVA
ncbi:MAG TPA: hypothetical protein VLU73_02370 [Methylococcaceae bacterium]|jgi:hypothetical protein|nr:hypothetical protein [Methylococcaceae bacterium]